MAGEPASGAAARRDWMAVLARADAPTIAVALAHAPPLPCHTLLRGPELGMVMVRGRIGGDGAAFNLGEITVARCTVQAGGFVGHAVVAGRDGRHAELAARLDAALQDARCAPALLASVVAVLQTGQAEAREREARQAAATRVEFATLATMRG